MASTGVPAAIRPSSGISKGGEGDCRLFFVELRRDFQRAALIESALDIMFPFKRHDVLMHRGERRKIQPLGDFLITGAVAPFFEKSGQEVEKLFLTFGKCHKDIIGEEKVNYKWFPPHKPAAVYSNTISTSVRASAS